MRRRGVVARLLLALLLAMAGFGQAGAQLPPPASRAPTTMGKHPWRVTLFQIDKSGTLLGDPKSFNCTQSGCEQILQLDVDGQSLAFLVAITFTPRGAYFNVSSMTDEVLRVVEFEKGFVGPLFLQVKSNERFNATLRYTLTGGAVAESQKQSTQLMQNDRSLVFQRRMLPDMLLKVSLEPAPAGDAAPIKPVE